MFTTIKKIKRDKFKEVKKALKKELKLRDYQVKPAAFTMKHNKVVLSLAPGAGKTEISIWAIEEYLKIHPNARVLILAHDTNVLLHNYVERLDGLNVSFTYSTDLNSDTQVHISIPQNTHKIKGQYDLLIVDEAHENYLADRVQKIVKQIKPKKETLLTGTPSKFIKAGGYKIYTVGLNDLPDKYIAKLNIELVASEYNWYGNYNGLDNVKATFNTTEHDTRKTLENLIPTLLERIKTNSPAKFMNRPNLLTKGKKLWSNIFADLGKTLLICNSIEQANITYDILISKGVKAGMSHSGNDKDSIVINEFKDSGYDILVVVDRGRLGYNNTELMNVIDLSGTHNPDLIYQMFCRVIRKPEDKKNKNKSKFFIKVTPKNKINMELTHMAVCAALMLTDDKYISKYDGTNFRKIIPVLKREYRKSRQGVVRKKNTNGNINTSLILPSFQYDIINTIKNVITDLDKTFSIYETTTIAHARCILDPTLRQPTKTLEDLIRSAAGKFAK